MNLLPEKIIYYYHCYGVTIELEVPDSTWKPDDALLQTHIPGIEIHHANHVTQHTINNSNKIKNNNTYQDSSLQSLFWKLAHPDLTLHIKIEVTDSNNNKNKNTNNDNNKNSTLDIQFNDEHHQKHVRLSINNSNNNSHSAHLKANTNIDSFNHLNIWKNDLPHFIYALLRQYWIETDLAPIHSLCAGNNLIIGHSGTGKSTLATELLTRHYPVFSLDRTLLHVTEQSLIPLAGTQVLSLRNNGSYNSIYNNNFNHVSSHDFEVIAQNAERTILKIKPSSETLIPTSGIKIDIGIDDMAHSHNSYKDNKIQTIYLLNINDGEFKVNALSALSALHTLYPYFMDKIKEDIILGGGEIVFSGKISSLAQQQLIQRLKKMVESIPVMSLWGNAQDCAEYLIHSSQKR
jgi:hypothetical protein